MTVELYNIALYNAPGEWSRDDLKPHFRMHQFRCRVN